jgi:hypothetical protein
LDPKIHIIRISGRVGERKRRALLDEIRHRNFHIANPRKEEEKPVMAEEPTTEEAPSSERTQTPSTASEMEEVTEQVTEAVEEESAEPEAVEESAEEEANEEEDK